MAGFGIALALIVVAIVAVPIRLWTSRFVASLRPRARRRVAGRPAPAHLSTRLRRVVRLGRVAALGIDELGPLGDEYRRTLPFLSLFFAERGSSPHLRRDRWVVTTRESFEGGVHEVAEALWAWSGALDRLDDDDASRVLGADTDIVLGLLDDGTRLPRSTSEARRFRFCEEEEVDRLLEDLRTVAAALRRLDTAVVAPAKNPYR